MRQGRWASGLMRRRAVALAVVVGCAGAVLAGVALAAPGDLDPGFDGDGRKTLDFGGEDFAGDVLVQPDGKIVIAGAGFPTTDLVVVRLNPDGSLDPGFDGDGIFSDGVNFGGDDYAYAVARQADGKLVVSGYKSSATDRVVVLRLNVDGSLDASFDGDGIKTLNLGGTGGAEDVLVQPDGKIVLVSTNTDFVVVRLNPDGSLDSSFDGDGIAFVNFGGDDIAYGVALYPGGKLVVVGTSTYAGMAVARLNADGSLDPTFDGDGMRAFDFTGSTDNGWDVLVQPNGFIVLAGEAYNDVAIVRLRPDGVLDATFDNDGIFGVNMGGQRGFAVAQQTDGKLVVGGSSGGDGLLLRLNADGSPDTSFGGDGKKTIDFGTPGDVVLGLALQADGRIVAAGSSASNIEVVRVEAEASPPPAPTPTITDTVPPGATPTDTPISFGCGGDCNGDGTVAISELIAAVNVALGSAAYGTCANADADRSGEVAINDLITAVNAALGGCVS